MANHTITITDVDQKCLETITPNIELWINELVSDRALVASKEISKLDVRHCNANGITIATGRDAQVIQAFDLGVVKTSAQRNAEAETNLPPLV